MRSQIIEFASYFTIFISIISISWSSLTSYLSLKRFSKDSNTVIQVPIFKSKPGSIVRSYVKCFGTIHGCRSTDVRFSERGRLSFVNTKIVKKGEVAVKLDTTEQDGAVQAAKAEMEKALRNYVCSEIRKLILGNTDDAQLHNAKNDAERAIGELQRAIGIRNRYEFKAPFTGRVGAVKFHIGQMVDDVVTAFAEIPNATRKPLTAVAHIGQEEAAHVSINQAAYVVMPDGSIYKGKVKKIDYFLNDFRYMGVEVAFIPKKQHAKLLNNMSVEVRIPKNDFLQSNQSYAILKTAIVLPTDTERMRGQKEPTYMFRVENSYAIKTEVEIVATCGKYCKVKSEYNIDEYVANGSIALDGVMVEHKDDSMYTTSLADLKQVGLFPREEATLFELKARLQAHKEVLADLQKEIEADEKKLALRRAKLKTTGKTEKHIAFKTDEDLFVQAISSTKNPKELN